MKEVQLLFFCTAEIAPLTPPLLEGGEGGEQVEFRIFFVFILKL